MGRRKKKDEGFDPEGDGPSFRNDSSNLTPEEKKAYAIKMRIAREGEKKKKKEPTEEEIRRGIERQELMNKTQFREPEDKGVNPNWVPPAPGTYGGPPLPRNTEEPKEDDES